ncbi:hypothetical protein [Altererythrobacter lutimaris]|uniref:Glycosyltransferase RgtA/B/C/D-like domain-containing protein n=1 Tax=Altererythrobacter lutimaris TaxID=2743979 RepID=A0A850HHK5_9SPHN|nr:hypothetical protein [Altererythrobacter lutimaris]NVE94592.1 hypothetical protein [Altererythrobacter lutimaris]
MGSISKSVIPKSVMQKPAIYLMIALVFLALQPHATLSRYYFVTHDAYVVLLCVVAWVASTRWTPQIALPESIPGAKFVVPVAIALCLALWAGTHWWMFDYPLTRDEHMAVFDAAIYADGKVAERLPEEWTGFARALVPAFLQDTPGNVLLVSGYLPVNSAMRGFFGKIADPALMNPLLAAIGFVSLWWIARRVFADNASAQWLVLLGYLLSAQILANGMTTYAMTGHLALNLLWLALFLKDRWWSHALAMLVGVLAMGLHQFVFHPLFAGPFVLWLLMQKKWLHVGAYGLVYLAGVALWMSWPGIVMDWAGVVPEPGKEGGISTFLTERILPLITQFDPLTIQYMTFNLVRGIGWNALFILPFVIAAGPAIKRRDPIALALLGGIVLTLVAMTILLPYQGHGWGYRYVHGLLGSFCLLAAFGYRELVNADKKWADGAAVLLIATTALIALPANLWSARSFTEPYVKLTQIVEARDTDYVMIDDLRHSSVVDQVRNHADLTNQPIVISRRFLTREKFMEICANGTVSLIDSTEIALAGLHDVPREEADAMPDPPCSIFETGSDDGLETSITQ